MTVEPYDRIMSVHPTLFEDIDSMEPDRFAQHVDVVDGGCSRRHYAAAA